MKVAIRYQSRGGNVKSMAEALSRGCGVEAIPINSLKAKIKETIKSGIDSMGHIASQKVAIGSGFVPAWAELVTDRLE